MGTRGCPFITKVSQANSSGAWGLIHWRVLVKHGQAVCSLPATAITNHHRLSDLKLRKCIIFWFWGQKFLKTRYLQSSLPVQALEKKKKIAFSNFQGLPAFLSLWPFLCFQDQMYASLSLPASLSDNGFFLTSPILTLTILPFSLRIHMLISTPTTSESKSLRYSPRIHISYKFPDDANASGPGTTHFENYIQI